MQPAVTDFPDLRAYVSVHPRNCTQLPDHVMTQWGMWSLIPPILTLGLALWTRNILLSLIIGALSGTWIISGGNPFTAVLSLVEDHMFVQIADPFNAQIIFVMMAIGGFIH